VKYLKVLALTIILLMAFLFLASRFMVWQTERAYPPQGKFIMAEDTKLHYVRDGSGNPVVMLHGRDGTLHEYTMTIFDRLAGNYDAIAFDRPGYGYSQRVKEEHLTTEGQAYLVNQALQKLGLENPLIIGHSYGGAVALQYLLDYPDQVKGAVLISGVAYIDEVEGGAILNIPNIPLVGPVLTNTLIPIGGRFASGIYEQAFWPAETDEAYVDTMLALYSRPSQFTATARELNYMYESVNAISPRYNEINVPVSIVFGTSDQLLDFETDGIALDDALPNSSLVLIEGGGHKIHHTHQDIILEVIDQMHQ